MTGKKTSASHHATPMPLDIFLFKAKRHCQVLQEKDQAVLDAYYVFAYSMDVSAERYRRIGALMQEVGEAVEASCILLSDTESLPPSVLPYRYLPLVTFQYMSEQIRTILPLISNARRLCKTSSRQKERLRREISNKLKPLRQDFHEGLRHVQELADQALLEERRMSRPSLSQQPQKLLMFPGIPHT
jgi:hypothetical protein